MINILVVKHANTHTCTPSYVQANRLFVPLIVHTFALCDCKIEFDYKQNIEEEEEEKTAAVEHTSTLVTTSQNNSEQHSDNAAKTISLIHFSFDLRDVYTHRT